MDNKMFCQSCSMPIDDPAMRGTEKDGSKSTEYCSYCYQNGVFINPNIALEEMKTIVKTQMEKRKVDTGIIDMELRSLPLLKRWRMAMSK